MNYLQYLFSDKKARIYWVVIFFAAIILTVSTFISHYSPENSIYTVIFDFAYLLLLCIIYIGFYTYGYLNYNKQRLFLNKYQHLIFKDSIQQKDVLLYFEKVTMKTFRGNYDAPISIKHKSAVFTVFKIKDYIGILGYTYDFGILRWHIRPLLIDLKGETSPQSLKYARIIKVNSIANIGANLEIKFSSAIYGINKLIINDWNY